MKCPKCGHLETSVVDSREAEDASSIRRRRECEECKYRFTTFEKARTVEFMVKKESGLIEPYDRDKLKKSIFLACGKRNLEPKAIEKLVVEIEEALLGEEEVKSRKLGKMVLKALKELDDIAYIRYASVYNKFESIEEFRKALEKIEE